MREGTLRKSVLKSHDAPPGVSDPRLVWMHGRRVLLSVGGLWPSGPRRTRDACRTVIPALPGDTGVAVDPFSLDDESDGGADLQEVFTETSPATLRAFLLVSVLVQIGLFAGSLGVMLVVFRRQWTLGTALVGAGLTALALAVLRYRRYRAAHRRREE